MDGKVLYPYGCFVCLRSVDCAIRQVSCPHRQCKNMDLGLPITGNELYFPLYLQLQGLVCDLENKIVAAEYFKREASLPWQLRTVKRWLL